MWWNPAVRIARGAAVIVTYAVLVVWLTWPLADNVTTHFPVTFVTATTDTLLAMWAAAHETRTLLSGASALADAGIYHPTANSLYYAEAGFGALPLFAPVFLASGNPMLAMNLVFLGGVVLTAAAIHAVTLRWTDSHAAGLVAGVSLVTTPWVLWWWIPNAPNYAVIFYLPFVMLLAAPITVAWGRTFGLGLLVALQSLTSPYVAFATAAPLAVLAAFRCLRSSTRIAGLHLMASLAMASALSVPWYWGYVQVKRENPHIEGQSLYAVQRFLNTVLPGDLFAPSQPTALPAVVWVVIFAGLLGRSLSAASHDAAHRREGWRHAGLWTIAGMYFSLTPHVMVAGMRLTLPHVVIAPVYATLRASGRFGVTTLVAGSVLAGVAFAECAAGRRAAVARAAGAACVIGLMLSTYFHPMSGLSRMLDPRADYPIAPAPVADATIQRAIARSEGALLELPVCPGPGSHAAAMYRSISHRRPLLNGYSGYYPADFPPRMALACRLPDPDAVAILVRTTDIGTILVHTRSLERSRLALGRAPYLCPSGPVVSSAHGAEAKAWWDASVPGARTDLQLIERDFDGDLLFRIVRP